MKAGFSLLKARIALIASAALVVAGAVPVLGLAGLVGWQVVMRFQSGKWLPLAASGVPVHAAVLWIAGIAGLAIAALGVLGVVRQRAAIRAHKQQREDRLRRMQDYLRDGQPTDAPDGRREPFISDRRAA
jgi:hypothetical protein